MKSKHSNNTMNPETNEVNIKQEPALEDSFSYPASVSENAKTHIAEESSVLIHYDLANVKFEPMPEEEQEQTDLERFMNSEVTIENEIKHEYCTENEYKCDKCSFNTYLFYTFLTHVNMCNGSSDCEEIKFSNQLSDQSFMCEISDDIDLHNIPDQTVACQICDKVFKHAVALDIHMAIHIKGPPFLCSHCDKTFSQSNDLNIHLDKHFNSFVNNIHLNEEAPNEEEHMKTQNDRNKIKSPGLNQTVKICYICKKVCKHASNLSIHMRTHTGEQPFKCKICDRTFNHIGNLKSHINRHSETKLSDEVVKNEVLEENPCNKNVECDICKRTFKYPRNLIRHVSSHIEITCNTINTCQLCFETFDHPLLLDVHMKFHSNEYLNHIQNVSSKRFNNLAEKPKQKTAILYRCEICNKSYKHASNLSTHKKIHFRKKKFLQCTICCKMFKKYKNLNIHLKIHEDNELYNCVENDGNGTVKSLMKCELCNKVVDDLDQHLKQHTESKLIV